MASQTPELPQAALRIDFEKPPEGPWGYMADMDFTSIRHMGCVFSLINHQMNRTPISHLLRPTMLTPEYRSTIVEMLQKARGNELLINILRWVAVQSDVTGSNPKGKIDLAKGTKLLKAIRELRLSVNHYVKEPRIYKAEYEQTKVYWKWMMNENQEATGVKLLYTVLGEKSTYTEFHHGINIESPMEEEDMENPKEEKNMFSDVLMKNVRTTRGGRSYGRSFEWEEFDEKAFEATATAAAKKRAGRKPQMIVRKSDNDDEDPDSTGDVVQNPCATNTKRKKVTGKPRVIVQTESDEDAPRAPTQSRTGTACVTCAVRKSACDKKKPTCTRCSDRSLVCTYPPGRGRAAKKTALPIRGSSKIVKEPNGESMFPGLVSTKRPSPGTPEAKGKKLKLADVDGSFGGESKGVWNGYNAEEDEIKDEVMLG